MAPKILSFAMAKLTETDGEHKRMYIKHNVRLE
jgi:hypothetical protein